ncbi:septal ring lytic transglycosylase RlpA family protein [Martelella alba]|uniref:Endolytic peptidoglycan transglycosylase RlpA n=1 Tax=Martelella alba TaxID=2590451 RepID=A0A506UIZ1_9HYPH|nr:septal ring lytic transglycosylase RlpA family protein [Martelella alba]TPW33276.1 septal ring lytic transglycosylase RlpA family protein [Martelella alba]
MDDFRFSGGLVAPVALIALSVLLAGCNSITETAKSLEMGSKKEVAKADDDADGNAGIRSYQKVGKPYMINGKWYTPAANPNYSKVGLASWYGGSLDGSLTANGETFDADHLSAAHTTMPLPSYARVTNLSNGYSVIVRVNDRGPFVDDRIIDVSHKTAQMLDMTGAGVAKVRVDYVGPAPEKPDDMKFLLASFKKGKTDQHIVDPKRFGDDAAIAKAETPAASAPAAPSAAVAFAEPEKTSASASAAAEEVLKPTLAAPVGQVTVSQVVIPSVVPLPTRDPGMLAPATSQSQQLALADSTKPVGSAQQVQAEDAFAVMSKNVVIPATVPIPMKK